MKRDFETAMTDILLDVTKRIEDNEERKKAIVERVRADHELLDYLTHPTLEVVVANRLHEWHSKDRWGARPENQEKIDDLKDGKQVKGAPRLVRQSVKNGRLGAVVMRVEYLKQTFGRTMLKDWVVADLRDYIATRLRAIGTERVQIKALSTVCDVCEEAAGDANVKVGDYLSAKTATKIFNGEYEPAKPKARRGKRDEARAT